MMMPAQITQSVPVIRAEFFRGVDGTAEGDTLSFADELLLDDSYALAPGHEQRNLLLGFGPRLQTLRVQPGSAEGKLGNAVHLDCCLTLMGPNGETFEALVLVEVEGEMAANIYLLPLSELLPEHPYRLIGIDRHAATRRFAEVACVSFAKGTRITMATGEQKPIEDMQIGDMVLTRDAGAQPVRWIGLATVRAAGDFAPIRIRAGTLANHADLLVSPDHRILVYQREDRIGAGQSEVMIKVRHLINGDSVVQESGGFVDYYQLLFDDHQILYAEGLASESLRITPRTRSAVPEHVARRVLAEAQAQRSHAPMDYEIAESLLTQPDMVALLKRASMG